jgi:MFS family permease
MTDAALTDPNARAKRTVVVLVLAQGLIGAQLPMAFIVAGLAGQTLAPNACLATLAITAMVVGSMAAATPLSALMARAGRRAGFVAGTLAGALGAAVSAAGLWTGSFVLFVLGAFLTGGYMSAQGFFRFAAADAATPEFRPKAISWVMAGGLLAAITGPQIVKLTSEAMVIPFLGTYLAAIAMNVAGVWLFAFLDSPRPAPAAQDAPRGRSRRELLSDPTIAVAVICATVSYALMNLVMTSSPLAVVGCGFETSDAADVVSAHVLAMYVPSFFTGHLIARFGARPIVATGLGILALAGVVAYAGLDLTHFFGALILLGIGWNFGFIGATAMLTAAHAPEERGRMQGLNDAIVFGGVTLASLSSGGLMNCAGASVVDGWHAVNIAMLPFLTLAGGALIWLALRPRAA